MKKILIAFVVLLLIIAGGAYYLLGNLDNIVKAAIEKYGSQVTQTSVNVGSVHIGLTDGLGSISGLKIGNPKGFSSDYLFKMDTVSVQMDVEKLSSELIVINQILLDGPSVIYEMSQNGSNVDAIQKNVNASTGGGSGGEDGSESAGPKLIVENLIVKNGDIQVTSNMVKGKTLSTKMEPIHIRDIGKSSGGATSSEVTKQVLAVLMKQISASAQKVDLKSLMDEETLKKMGEGKLKDVEKGAMDKIKKLF